MSPPYVAVMEYEAPAKVLLVSVATPELFNVPVPSLPITASAKVTVPVGVLVEVEDGFTVAVRVTLVPALTGDTGDMASVVVVAVLTLSCVTNRLASTEPIPVTWSSSGGRVVTILERGGFRAPRSPRLARNDIVAGRHIVKNTGRSLRELVKGWIDVPQALSRARVSQRLVEQSNDSGEDRSRC